MEWKTVKLGEVCDIRRGASPRPIQEFLSSQGMPWIKISDATATDSKYIDKTKEFIIEEGVSHSVLIEPGTLIVSNSATPGLPKISRITACVHDGWLVIDNFRGILKDFLYYKFIEIRSILGNQANGSVFMNLKTDIVKEFLIHIPDIEKQRKIVSILSSLDDKIENNNRINRNLEAQAQALFKSWFVDFEPWGGKMPEDWKEGVYNDIIEKTISGDWGKERPEGNYDHSVACIRGCDFEDINNGIRGKTPQRYILEKNYQNKGLKNRDIVVEISGGTATVSTGRVCLITEKLLQKYDYDIVCTNFCRTIRPLADYYTYLYYSWKYKYDQKIMFGYENGTSGIKNFAVKDFIEKEPLIIPSCDIVKSFNKIISVLHDKIQENGTESQRLATLRDTLLPKLMRGEIAL